MNIQYCWSLFQRSLSFSIPTFGLHRICAVAKALKISCGFWITLTADEVNYETRLTNLQTRCRAAIYQPLNDDSIRLLLLHPAAKSEPLQGEFMIFNPNLQNVDYTTLSYAWGSTESQAQIRINEYDLPLTQNLEQYLRHIRHRSKPIILWVDAICINQHDISEKNQQVGLMSHIYQGAHEVHVWLGEESEWSSVGMEVLNYFATHPRPFKDAIWQALPPELVLLGLADVMDREWFKRIWVVQEVALSRYVKLVCGRATVEWPRQYVRILLFMQMIKFACVHPEWRGKGLDSIKMRPLLELLDLQIGQLQQGSCGGPTRPTPDLLHVAYDLRNRFSKDPRDMLFALAGLFEHIYGTKAFVPNYLLTVEASFWDLQNFTEFCRGNCEDAAEHASKNGFCESLGADRSVCGG